MWSDSPRIILRRKFILPVTSVVTIPSIAFLTFLGDYRSYYGFPFSKMVILNSYVSDPDDSGLHIILTLIMSQALSSSFSGLDRGMGGGSIRA